MDKSITDGSAMGLVIFCDGFLQAGEGFFKILLFFGRRLHKDTIFLTLTFVFHTQFFREVSVAHAVQVGNPFADQAVGQRMIEEIEGSIQRKIFSFREQLYDAGIFFLQ